MLSSRVCEDMECEYYDFFNMSSSITGDATVCLILVLIVLVDRSSYLDIVNGTFLLEVFENGEELFIRVLK